MPFAQSEPTRNSIFNSSSSHDCIFHNVTPRHNKASGIRGPPRRHEKAKKAGNTPEEGHKKAGNTSHKKTQNKHDFGRCGWGAARFGPPLSPRRLPPETRFSSALVHWLTLALWSVASCSLARPIAGQTRRPGDTWETLWLVASCSLHDSVDPYAILFHSSTTITLTDANRRWTSASKNFTLHFLAPVTNSNTHLPPPGWHFRSLLRSRSDKDLNDLVREIHGNFLLLFSALLRRRQFSTFRIDGLFFSSSASFRRLDSRMCSSSCSERLHCALHPALSVRHPILHQFRWTLQLALHQLYPRPSARSAPSVLRPSSLSSQIVLHLTAHSAATPLLNASTLPTDQTPLAYSS